MVAPKANALLTRAAKEEDPSRVYFRPCGTEPGEAHGPYRYDPAGHYRRMNAFAAPAYTEFACGGMANLAALRAIFPPRNRMTSTAPPLAIAHPATDRPGDAAVFACESPSSAVPQSLLGRAERTLGRDLSVLFRRFRRRSCSVRSGMLPQYVAASQFLSGEGLRYVIEEQRRKRDRASATFVWQLQRDLAERRGQRPGGLVRPTAPCAVLRRQGLRAGPCLAALRADRLRGGETFRRNCGRPATCRPGRCSASRIGRSSTTRERKLPGGRRGAAGRRRLRELAEVRYPIPAGSIPFSWSFVPHATFPAGRSSPE